MEITHASAQEALGQIQATSDRTRKAVILAGAAPILITWGLVWLVGYLATHFLVIHQAYTKIGPVWWILSGLGMAVTILFSFKNPIRIEGGWRIGLLWWGACLAGAFWLKLFWPWNPAQMNLFLASLIMFLWVMIGLILNNPLWTVSGIIFLLLIMAGYLILAWNPLIWIWMAVTCGGGMLAMGLVTLFMGRRHGRA